VPVQSGDVLSRVLSGLKPAMEECGARIIAGPLPTVMVDGTQLEQLLQNLLGNALKFRGQRTPIIHVECERRSEQWVFAVRDNGIGIDPAYYEKIFVIFQRLHGNDTYEGSGIGLAICKKIVERHGGRIWVDSTPGQGSTFYFTLPVPAVVEMRMQRSA